MSAQQSQSSLSFEQRLQLMAYADGELDALEAAAAERLILEHPEAQAMLEELRSLSSRITELHFTAPDLSDAIMAQLAAPATPEVSAPGAELAYAPGATVIDWQSVRAHRYKLLTAAATLVAAAAAVGLWVRQAAPLSLPVEPQLSALGVEIERVDSQENVTVFSIPAQHSEGSSVVVWLGDAEAERAAPLLNAGAEGSSTSEPLVE